MNRYRYMDKDSKITSKRKKPKLIDTYPKEWVTKGYREYDREYGYGDVERLKLFGYIEEKGNRFWYIDKDKLNAINQIILEQNYEPK